MKTYNYGDKYEKRITLRLTETQFEYLTKVSTLLGTTPSDYLRMVINASAISTSKSVDELMKGDALKVMGGTSNENVKTNFIDKL